MSGSCAMPGVAKEVGHSRGLPAAGTTGRQRKEQVIGVPAEGSRTKRRSHFQRHRESAPLREEHAHPLSERTRWTQEKEVGTVHTCLGEVTDLQREKGFHCIREWGARGAEPLARAVHSSQRGTSGLCLQAFRGESEPRAFYPDKRFRPNGHKGVVRHLRMRGTWFLWTLWK